MKTAIIVRICLICIVVISAAFFAVKMNILWNGKSNDDPSQSKDDTNSYTLKSDVSNKTTLNTKSTSENHYKPDQNDYDIVPVETTKVRKSDIEIFLVNNCTLEPEKQVDVMPKTSGIVENIMVEEGDLVKLGETLAELNDEELLLALKEAEIKKENEERIYERSLKSIKDNIISKEEFEDIKFRFDSALIELEKKQLEYKYATIKSPIEGVVIERNIEEGYNVKEDQAVFRIADFEPILSRIFVPEKDFYKVKEGQTARIISEFSAEVEFAGKVKMVSPIVDPESGTVKVTIEVVDSGLTDGDLLPGMFVSVYTIVGQHKDALIIPKQALILEAETDEVFVVKEFITVYVKVEEFEELDIGNTVICKQKRSEVGGALSVDDHVVEGNIIDISTARDDSSTLAVTIEAKDIINRNINSVFETVSFYNQDVLTAQTKDTVFDSETRAFKTKVTLGFKEGEYVEVLTGLKESDRIITVGQDDVGHRASVIVVDKEEKDKTVIIERKL